MPLFPAALLADLAPGSLLELESGNATYALCNVDGVVHCVNGLCPHAGGPLAQGGLHGETIICPWHGWEFNVRTGTGEECSLQTFPVVVEAGQIFIQVP